MVPVSSASSVSSLPDASTRCGELQLDEVNVRLGLSTVMSVLVGASIVTVTSPVGSLPSTTVYSPVAPSSMRSEVGLTVTPRVSLSVMLTVATLVVPLETRRGGAPNASLTRSPSSSMASSTGVNVSVCSVSSLANVTVVGSGT